MSDTTNVRPFHLAIPVSSLDNARSFYGDVLGLSQGRSSDEWIDWNFFGHQFVTHVAPNVAGLKITAALMVIRFLFHILALSYYVTTGKRWQNV